ncbi:hypothetical protein DSM03_10812 [Leeuwenhoekiella aestuarii]|uniref:hypothetical protein n=1 Tax=Leeuwenhoekiella aestuarii TaxID=2249426 RepID=UPI000FFE9B88|nr:hypothetical protein [Leeuwenhoekiella aestuarii]RXG12867.1 hypothetical protein DSM03_10812 [Leeuwenhoekiella aestuarii]
MNEDQAKKLLKKSELQATDHFTDSLMKQIEADVEARVQATVPSIKKVSLTIVAVVLPLFLLLFFKTFTFLPRLEFLGYAHRTKLFVVAVFSVLLAVNHLFKLHYSAKQLVKNER